jgi:hypothetical protein
MRFGMSIPLSIARLLRLLDVARGTALWAHPQAAAWGSR